jgi:hypothetical protein
MPRKNCIRELTHRLARLCLASGGGRLWIVIPNIGEGKSFADDLNKERAVIYAQLKD